MGNSGRAGALTAQPQRQARHQPRDPVTPQDILGYCAAALTTGSFLPQALLTLRTRDVSGISIGMYGAFTAGVALWLMYGVALGNWPIVAANAVTLVLAATILWVKIVEDRRAQERGLRNGKTRPQNK